MNSLERRERLPWHDSAWAQFESALQRGTMPHAWLIHGPNGVGKHHLALQFAQQLICENNSACGHCRSCIQFNAGCHADYCSLGLEEDKEIISVDAIRRLTEFIYTTRQVSNYHVALIHPAQALNINAANALLKTLEEPPPAAVILLVGSQVSRLPATILSRCRQLPIARPAANVAADWLQTKVGNHDATAMTANLLAMAQGSPLTALDWLQSDWQARETRWMNGIDNLLKSGGSVIAFSDTLTDMEEHRLFIQWLDTHCRLALAAKLGHQPYHGVLRAMENAQLVRVSDEIRQVQRYLEKPLRWNWQAASLVYDMKLTAPKPTKGLQ